MDAYDTTTSTMPAVNSTVQYEEEATYEEKLAISIILGIISVCGTFGNGLVLYVFTRKSDKVTSTIFILALAWTDLFTCMVIVPYTVVSIQTGAFLMYDVACKMYQFLITCNVPLSAFIMVAIAVDRYFSICHPFLHAVTPKRAKIAIFCLCLFAFTLGTITACMYSVYKEQNVEETVGIGEASWCTNLTGGLFSEDTGPTTQTFIDLGSGANSKDADSSTNRPGGNLAYGQDVEIIINDGRSVQAVDASNAVVSYNCSRNVSKLVYMDGLCNMDFKLFSESTVETYANIYASFYAISLLLVFTLYFFIYRSVVRRRAWRRKQKSWSHSPMTTAPTAADNTSNKSKTTKSTSSGSANQENMELVKKHPNGNDTAADKNENGKETSPMKQVTVENGSQPTSKVLSSAEKKASRERRDFNFLANIRTAGMLFVVAVVFIISFLPSWLMACRLIDFNIVVFYMYFVYNTANPVIYAFMNQSFRKELKRVFQRGTHFLRSG